MDTTTRSSTLLRVFQPLERFLGTETRSSTLLLGVTLAALIVANSAASAGYHDLLHTYVKVAVGPWEIASSLAHWINDGLMAAFFLLVGLEIKREVVEGELATWRKAALPAIAAVGGMVVPAALYALVAGGPGWGVPMATDIAFAIGVARLVGGSRVPIALVVFLTALAIIDDLGAILVIAIFYGHELNVGALAAAAGITAGLVAMNFAGVRLGAVYVLVGLLLWLAVFESGLHATLAGVIVGWSVPAARGASRDAILPVAQELVTIACDPNTVQDDVDAALDALEDTIDEVQSPLSELEHGLHPYVAFGVLPIFAFVNAGVAIEQVGWATLADPVTLGVIAGLFVGKPLGIVGASAIAVKAGLAELPAGVTWAHLLGAGCMGGIGFTMSLFIAALAFDSQPEAVVSAKLGILAASALSAAAGAVILGRAR
jgi:NhaA family Na+:H+ antiporter